MRLLVTAVNCPKGEVTTNLDRHLVLLEEGRRRGCDLVLLPEMSLTGYRPAAAISVDHPAVRELVRGSTGGPALCFGLVEEGASGRPAYITQLVARRGQPLVIHRKARLGDGEDGDFVAGPAADRFEVGGTSCSLAVCAEIGTGPPYRLGSRLILGPAAPGLYGDRRDGDQEWRHGFDWWRGSVVDDARRLLRPGQFLAVSTQAGSTDDEDFPGWAAVLGPGGVVLAELPDWREGTLVVDVPTETATTWRTGA